MGTPQVRWREIHQSARSPTIGVIRFSPGRGSTHVSDGLQGLIPEPATEANHCSVARKMVGFLVRQS
jgi:hypothetical protein